MAQNPFADLIPTKPGGGAAPAAGANPFADLIPAPTPGSGKGRLASAGASAVQGAAEMLATVPQGVAISRAQGARDMLAAFDRIDRGEEPAFGDFPAAEVGNLRRYQMADLASRQALRSQFEGEVDPRESPLYEAGTAAGEAVREAMPTNPAYQGEFFADLIPRAIGSTGGFLAGGLLARVLGLPALPTTAGLGMSVSAAGQFEDALEKGGSIETGLKAAGWALPAGASEALPIAKYLDILDKGSGGTIKRLLIETAKGGTEELLQELGQTIAQNAIAQKLYDPKRGLFLGAPEAGGAAFTSGALFSFLLGIAGGRRAAQPQPQPQPVAPAQTAATSPPPVQPAPAPVQQTVPPAQPAAVPVAPVPPAAGPVAAADILARHGLPPVSTPVIVTYPDGRTATGTVADAFAEENAELGISGEGVKITLDDGSTLDEFFPVLDQAGVKIAVAPRPAAEPAGVPAAVTTTAQPLERGAPQAPAVAPAPIFTKSMQARLGKLGYGPSDLGAMTRADALRVIAEGLRKTTEPAAVGEAPEAVPVVAPVAPQPAGVAVPPPAPIQDDGTKAAPTMTVEKYVEDYLAGKGRGTTPEDLAYQQFAANNAAEIEAEFARRAAKGDGSKAAPAVVETGADLDAARAANPPAAAISPGQAKAGNFRQTHVRWNGFNIAIETPKGGVREDKANDPPAWRVENFPADYGRIKGVPGRDGDELDVYLGPTPESPRVFIVNQIDPETGVFDEHKVMAGFKTKPAAMQAYQRAFSDGSGRRRIGTVATVTIDQFKDWLRSGNLKKAAVEPQVIAPAASAPTTHVASFGTPKQQHVILRRAVDRLGKQFSSRLGLTKKGGQWTVKLARGTDAENRTIADEVQRQIQMMIDRSAKARERGQRPPESVLEFIAAKGGLRDDEGHDLRRSRNAQRTIPGRGTLIRANGKSIDAMGEALHEAGYLGDPDSTKRPSVAEVLDLLDEALAGRDTTSESRRAVAEERQDRRDTEIAEDAEARAREEVKAIASDMGEILAASEIGEIVAAMGREGLDAEAAVVEHIERLAIQTAEKGVSETEDETYDDIPFEPAEDGDAARPAGPGRTREAGDAGPGPARGAAAPQGRGETGEEGEVAPPPAERFSLGRTYTKDERKKILATLVDVYKAAGLGKTEFKGVGRDGNERWGYPYSPDIFRKSDITGAMVRYYITLPDGLIAHPTELFPNYKESDIEAEMRRRDEQARVLRVDVERYTRPGVQFDTVTEAARYWDEKSQDSRKDSAGGWPTINPASERDAFTNGSKIVMVWREYLKRGELVEALAEAGWKLLSVARQQPTTETVDTADGPREQAVIPGAERISDKELAERRMAGRKKAKAEQKPADEGLFDTGARKQTEMFARAPVDGGRGSSEDGGGSQESANAQTRKDLEALRRNIEAYANRGRADSDRVQFDPGTFTAAELPDAVLYGRIAAAFGKRIVGFKVAPAAREAAGFFDGLTLRRTAPGVIFINVDAVRPHLTILGHELVHWVEVEAPDLYTALRDIALDRLDERRADNYIRARQAEGYGDNEIGDELLGDIVGDGVLNRRFWDGVGQTNPTLLQRLANAVNQIVARLRAALGGLPAPRTEAVFTDFDTVLRIAGQVMGEYSRRQAGGTLSVARAGKTGGATPANLAALESDLTARLSALGIADRVALKLVGSIRSIATGKMTGAEGRYTERLIEIATSARDAGWTLNHESIHALKGLHLLRNAEWGVLERAALADRTRMAEVRHRYRRLDLTEAEMVEEAIADMFADWSAGRARVGGIMRAAFERIRSFLEALGNALRGAGFQTADDVFGRIERGEVGARDTDSDMMDPVERFMVAYHGSPHDFDEFNLGRIGTGEGAQAFGWGLYFAGRKGVAQHYRDKLSGRGGDAPRYNGKTFVKSDGSPINWNPDMLADWGADADWILKFMVDNGHETVRAAYAAFPAHKKSLGILKRLTTIGQVEPVFEALIKGRYKVGRVPGRLYTVDLAPTEDEYLLWDKRLSEQSEKVKAALDRVPPPTGKEGSRSFGEWVGGEVQTGRQAYEELARGFREGWMASVGIRGRNGQRAASETLRAAGIPGIKYLDGGSRNRPLKDIKREFLAELSEDATIEEVEGLLGTGHFSPKSETVLAALQRDDWLGFDHPAQAISAAYSGSLQNWDPSPELVRAVADSQDDGTYNYVIFDDSLVKVVEKFSIAHDARQGPDLLTWNRDALDLGATKGKIKDALDSFRTAVQDRFLPLLRIQQQIEAKAKTTLTDEQNAYLVEEGFSGRAGERLLQFEIKVKKPLIEAIHKSGLGLDRIEEYLYARHAPERNAQVAKINPEMPDGGSGMTDAAAAAVIEKAKADGIKTTLDGLADLHDAIHKEAMKARVELGLLSARDAALWAATYKHYTPLRGLPDMLENVVAGRPNQGKGYSVRGPESKRAMGRKTVAKDLIAHSLMQAEEAFIRGEKNQVGLALMKMAAANPDPAFWIIDKVEVKRRVNPATGEVENYSTVDRNDPNTILVKRDGEQHRIWLADERLAHNLKNMDADKVGLVIRGLMRINRYLSMMNTGLNPEFIISNAFRDIQAGAVNLSQYEMKGLVKSTLRDYPKALRAAWGGVKGRGVTEWQRHYREYARAGGQVNFWKMDDVQEHRSNLDRDLKRMGQSKFNVMGGLRAALEMIEDGNRAVDNAVRLSAYVNARRRGMSQQKAASLAKNLTVNFNRRGEMGPTLNALYLFFNASIQGTMVLARTASTKPGRRLIYAMIAAGFAAEMVNAMLSPDDDDGEKKYDKISAFDKSRNFIFMNPSGAGPDFFKIPMPYGYNAFVDLGRNIAAYARGQQSAGESLGNAASTFFDAFNPVGGTDNWLNLVAPTVLDPIADLERNRDFANRKIMPETSPFEPAVPDSERYWGSVSPISREIATRLNAITGGSEFKSGAIDWSPETLDHWAGFVGGAAVGFVKRAILDLPAKLVTGQTLEANDLPFVRKVVGTAGGYRDTGLMYDRLTEIDALVAQVRTLHKRGDQAEAEQARSENGALYSLRPAANGARDKMSAIRKQLERVRSDATLDWAERRRRIQEIEERRRKIVEEFNRLYVERVLEPERETRALIDLD